MEKVIKVRDNIKVNFETILKYNRIYIIWFAINFLICWWMFGFSVGAFFLLLFVYAISICVALSPVGEWLLRLLSSARPVLTKEEKEYLEPIFSEVYEAIKEKNPELKGVNLYLQDVMTANAFAIGRQTVALTKGAVETFSEDELKGILAHELGHIAHGDTFAILLNTIGNGIFAVIVCILRFFLRLMNGVARSIDNGFIGIISNVANFMLELVIFALIFVGQAVMSINSRKSEFSADKYAYEIGYGNELVGALYLLQKMTMSEKMSVKERLQASHPILAWRISRMEGVLDGETFGIGGEIDGAEEFERDEKAEG